jgi:predicted phage gp36 major capsid-like protein
MIVNKSESIISRVNKIRDNIMDELKNAKVELTNKIEDADKYYGEQLEITQASIDRNKVLLKELILRTKEDLQG